MLNKPFLFSPPTPLPKGDRGVLPKVFFATNTVFLGKPKHVGKTIPILGKMHTSILKVFFFPGKKSGENHHNFGKNTCRSGKKIRKMWGNLPKGDFPRNMWRKNHQNFGENTCRSGKNPQTCGEIYFLRNMWGKKHGDLPDFGIRKV